jgi:hypothetical protein
MAYRILDIGLLLVTNSVKFAYSKLKVSLLAMNHLFMPVKFMVWSLYTMCNKNEALEIF